METALPADNAVPVVVDRSRWRTTSYCLVLAALAATLMFWELGADALTGDEAQYALVAQNLTKPAGNWLDTTPYPPTHYFEKPPLYFWLTASTYNLLGGGEFAERAWSAAAGVAAVVVTCILGALLFTPEIGGFAGLLLLMNRSFLLDHGARSGTFDALVTFLLVLATLFYWLAVNGRCWWICWIGLGIAAGLASITKPFVGVPLFALVAFHALFVARATFVRARIGGVAISLLVLAAVTAPWYLAQWRLHDDFVNLMFRRNLAQRILSGVDDKHIERWTFYPQEICKSSLPFLLVIPASLFAVFRWLRGPQRSPYGLVVIVSVGWIVLFSLSVSKGIHYVFPAFPALAILLAAGAVELSRRIGGRASIVGGVLLLAGFSFQFARTLYHTIPEDRSPYVPWEFYKVLSPPIRAKQAQIVFYGFPERQIDWRSQLRLGARDCYYLEQMRSGAGWARSKSELAELLHDGKPTLLLLSRTGDLRGLLAGSNIESRSDARFTYSHQGYLALGVDLQSMLSPTMKPGETNPFVQIASANPASGEYRLAITPPIANASARIVLRLRVLASEPSQKTIRYVFAVEDDDGKRRKTLEDRLENVSDGILDVSAIIEQSVWRGPVVHHLKVQLRTTEKTILLPTMELDEAQLIMLPNFAPERHPRR